VRRSTGAYGHRNANFNPSVRELVNETRVSYGGHFLVNLDSCKFSVDMGVIQKKRRALSDTQDSLPTQPQVPASEEQKQGEVAL
jgi:hypothetical protein